jgi:hypothetical protein
MQAMVAAGRPAAVTLMPGVGPTPPNSDSGPFRVQLVSIHHHRDLSFAQGPGMMMFGGDMRPAPAMPNGGAPGQARGVATDTFFANLQLMAEPRMTIAQQGTLRLTEAVDDRGNDLLPPAATPTPFTRHSGFNQAYVPGGTMNVNLTAVLKYPDQPGKMIRRLRGVIPVVVSARKEDPISLPLAEAKGKTLRTTDVHLTISDVKADPDNPRQTSIDLTVRPAASAADGVGGMARLMFNDMAFRFPTQGGGQIEVVDAQGRVYPHVPPSRHQFGADEMQMTLTVTPHGPLGPPAEIRCYDSIRANAEATFEFTGIAMP